VSDRLAEIKGCTPELNEYNCWMLVESDYELTSWPPDDDATTDAASEGGAG